MEGGASSQPTASFDRCVIPVAVMISICAIPDLSIIAYAFRLFCCLKWIVLTDHSFCCTLSFVYDSASSCSNFKQSYTQDVVGPTTRTALFTLYLWRPRRQRYDSTSLSRGRQPLLLVSTHSPPSPQMEAGIIVVSSPTAFLSPPSYL